MMISKGMLQDVSLLVSIYFDGALVLVLIKIAKFVSAIDEQGKLVLTGPTFRVKALFACDTALWAKPATRTRSKSPHTTPTMHITTHTHTHTYAVNADKRQHHFLNYRRDGVAARPSAVIPDANAGSETGATAADGAVCR